MLFVDSDTDTVVVGATTDPDTWTATPVTGDGLHVQDKNVIIASNTSDAFSSVVAFNKSRNATDGSHTIVQSGDVLGEINFLGSDGSNFELAGQVKVEVDTTPGNNDMPGRIVFSTTADGASSLAERMRIDSNGSVGIGTTSAGSTLSVAGSVSLKVAGPKTSGYSIAEDDYCVIGDCNGGSITLTLPSATDAMSGRTYVIKRLDSGNSGGGNTLTVSRNGKNIDGFAGDKTLANQDALIFQCLNAASGWIIIGSYVVPM